MSDVRCEPAWKEKFCITNVCTCLPAFAAAGIMGALREMWGKSGEMHLVGAELEQAGRPQEGG